MKYLLICTLALASFQSTCAQTPTNMTAMESQAVEYLTFPENYNAHAAYVFGNRWTTSLGNQPLGYNWKKVAAEFENSPEGQADYLLAQKQKRMVPVFLIPGYGFTLGAIPVLFPTLLSSSPSLDFQRGIGIGMLAGGLVLTYIAGRKLRNSANNFDKALWLRNRDEMLRYVSPTDQPRFKYLYETETLYLTTNSYIRNGQEHRLGILGHGTADEFRNVPMSWDLYKKYRNRRYIGGLLYVAGWASAVLLPNSTRGTPLLYYGGLSVAVAGGGVMLSSRKFLSQAVYLRNQSVMERQMLRD